MELGIIRRISILHVIFAQHKRVVAVQHDTRGQRAWLLDAVIPHRHAVEVRTAVQTDETMLGDAVGIGAIGQLYGKAQRAIVQYAVALVAVGKYQFAVFHQGRCTTPQRGSHTVGIHAVAMVQMERRAEVYVLQRHFLAGLAERLLQQVSFVVLPVAFVCHQVGRVLDPHVSAKRAFARLL